MNSTQNSLTVADAELKRYEDAVAAGMKTVLFVCSGNAVRSQMAEALTNRYLPEWEAFSGGVLPMEVNRYVIRALAEDNIDWKGKSAKHVAIFSECRFDRVIVLCSDADRYCPDLPMFKNREVRNFEDPLMTPGTPFFPLPPYRRLRDEMKKKIPGFLNITGQNTLQGENRQ